MKIPRVTQWALRLIELEKQVVECGLEGNGGTPGLGWG